MKDLSDPCILIICSYINKSKQGLQLTQTLTQPFCQIEKLTTPKQPKPHTHYIADFADFEQYLFNKYEECYYNTLNID